MKLLQLILADIRFQWKYGFYLLYAIFIVIYTMVIVTIPENTRQTITTIMIFTDPAAMGLFFMGAIILLEKSQKVDYALATTSISFFEYIFAKLISLAVIGIIVGLVLAIVGGITNKLTCIVGIIFTSILCTSCGLIAAERSKSLNQFILFAIPFELFLCIPPILLLFGIESPYLITLPGVAAVWLIYGETQYVWFCLLSLLVWCIPTILFCLKSIKRYFYKTEDK